MTTTLSTTNTGFRIKFVNVPYPVRARGPDNWFRNALGKTWYWMNHQGPVWMEDKDQCYGGQIHLGHSTQDGMRIERNISCNAIEQCLLQKKCTANTINLITHRQWSLHLWLNNVFILDWAPLFSQGRMPHLLKKHKTWTFLNCAYHRWQLSPSESQIRETLWCSQVAQHTGLPLVATSLSVDYTCTRAPAQHTGFPLVVTSVSVDYSYTRVPTTSSPSFSSCYLSSWYIQRSFFPSPHFHAFLSFVQTGDIF